ncbi:putative HNHc nuclease [Enterococcus cecorum]
MGNNRKKHDHINSSFMALCREHHILIHNIGLSEFMKRYNVFPVKLNNETIKRLNI